ncbi:MAG: YncE family protein [Candidatus Eisenbacteria bacterium]|nr:YncE family protein [Candidatus Eisenbacteria bacterium]
MIGRARAIAAITCVAIALVVSRATAAGVLAPVLEQVTDVALPGPAVRFDYQTIDTTANRLYFSHMNAGEVLVLDLTTRTIVGTVRDLPRVTGVWCVPTLGKVYASVPGHHHVAVINARTLTVEARVGAIGFPDGIAYAPGVKKVYVSDESGRGELVIDGESDRVVTTIDLGGEAGNTLYDPASAHILVAVQTKNQVVEIDPTLDRIVARHDLSGASHPHGMSVDATRRLLFVASEGNATLQAVDLRTWKVVDRQPVGDDPDVLAFDPDWRRLYVAAESGPVTVFSEVAGKLALAGQVTLPHGHTVSVDPRTHLVYFPLQDVGGHPVLRIMAGQKP